MAKLWRFGKKRDADVGPPEEGALEERLRGLKDSKRAGAESVLEGARRVGDRQTTHRVGEIALESGKTLSCIVEDFSDTGMRLLITEEGAAPESFRLRVPTLEFDRVVSVVWRKEPVVGVSYC